MSSCPVQSHLSDFELEQYVTEVANGGAEINFILEDVSCPSCALLAEHKLGSLEGVLQAQVNVSTNRLKVQFDKQRVDTGSLIRCVAQAGARAVPYDAERQEQAFDKERKEQLKHLLVAWLLGAQVMMLSLALYGGDWWGMEVEHRALLRWMGLVLCAPVIGYCAQSFFVRAWAGVRAGRPGMDLPVVFGLSMAFAASFAAVLTGEGAVYFESITMFVGLLLLARFLEMMARHRSIRGVASLLEQPPSAALLLDKENGETRPMLAAQLRPGDWIRVFPGAAIPADARVVGGSSSVDASMLTGESRPRQVHHGDLVLAGAVNHDGWLDLEVERSADRSTLAELKRLVSSVESTKPRTSQLADRIAPWFICTVLLLATVVGLQGWLAGSAGWLDATIAVLIVTCPCALSLATPSALAVATGSMDVLD